MCAGIDQCFRKIWAIKSTKHPSSCFCRGQELLVLSKQSNQWSYHHHHPLQKKKKKKTKVGENKNYNYCLNSTARCQAIRLDLSKGNVYVLIHCEFWSFSPLPRLYKDQSWSLQQSCCSLTHLLNTTTPTDIYIANVLILTYFEL